MDYTGQVRRAAEILRSGGVAAFPTETVYVLGADVHNRKAVERLFDVKKRPRFDPLIVHIADRSQVAEFVDEVPDKARALMDAFWPGGLTLILPRKEAHHTMATAGQAGVALRLPSNEIALEIIRQAGTPIAVASANSYGNVSPTAARHVRDDLGPTIDVVDGGPCAIGIETTVVDFMAEYPVSLRPGAIPLEDIEQIIGPVRASPAPGYASFFPGMSDHHYTRKTVMLFMDEMEQLPRDVDVGLLSFKPVENAADFEAVEVLSQTGDLAEAARNLFASLRRLDTLDLDLVAAQRVPNVGLGVAINDRLWRASF